MPEQILVYTVIGGTLALLIWGRFRYDMVALIAVTVLALAGLLEPADIAQGGGAQQRVGQRMQRHVGVGMPLQRAIVRQLEAAQPDAVAARRGESVHVETLADPQVAQAGQLVEIDTRSRCRYKLDALR